MAVTLRPITPHNWRACIQLNTTEVQRHFVASVVTVFSPASLFNGEDGV